MHFDVGYFLGFVFHPPLALLRGLLTTVLTTFVSMAFGVLLGLLLSVCGLAPWRPLRWLNSAYIFVFRGTPLLVQVIIIYFGLPYLTNLDLFPQSIQLFGVISLAGAIMAGVTAFALHEAAYFSEISRAAIASVDWGQWEAGKALGMSPGLVMQRVILPQAVRIMLPPLGNQINGMFKATSLLYLIAVPEMLFIADAVQSVNYKTIEVYLGVSVYYLALTTAWGFAQEVLEKRYSRGFGSI
ncbi:amino acid ABC transporter permease [Paraburkholderia phenoliruptrix]|uniref:ABC polar amino acid transporter, inner membrane subunit n=2 Tax=Paraburkholderia phenoliruptrix TaxID=252970 RepID=K0E1Y9_9BURK|nr:amino acid ABC transporter permease [Paraburkholderia phenoliruptrix]AFT90508.1 ABC polar amino acid transporter, inner membrane subunit [Paraburkholderia phenoliruptrix BR3459a]CAB4053012.1 L-cystine transport system permease protein YecS [Paraburkholderia phenoliruptrix]